MLSNSSSSLSWWLPTGGGGGPDVVTVKAVADVVLTAAWTVVAPLYPDGTWNVVEYEPFDLVVNDATEVVPNVKVPAERFGMPEPLAVTELPTPIASPASTAIRTLMLSSSVWVARPGCRRNPSVAM